MAGQSAADPIVDETFQSYYQALAGFDQRELERELRTTVDDALLTGSHLDRPSTDAKRRQIAEETLTGARASAQWRGGSSATPASRLPARRPIKPRCVSTPSRSAWWSGVRADAGVGRGCR